MSTSPDYTQQVEVDDFSIRTHQLHAIFSFLYSAWNESCIDIVTDAFDKERVPEPLKQHLMVKLEKHSYNIIDFLGDLDEPKRGILINYILDTYAHGPSLAKIQHDYQGQE